MWIIFLVFLVIILMISYPRYVPVKGVKCLKTEELAERTIKVDLRDYNDSVEKLSEDSIQLPIAYIKRHHHELPKEVLYVIARNNVEKNLGIRLLKRHGYTVAGYAIVNKKCYCKKRLAKFV